MKKLFVISKWTLIIGAIIYNVLTIVFTIIVGSAGHNREIDTSNSLSSLLMIIFLSCSHKFENTTSLIFEILNWLTIALVTWVMINIVKGSIIDDYKGEEWLITLYILLPMVVCLIVVVGFIKKMNRNKI